MTWEDFWIGIIVALLAIGGVLLVAGTWIFQVISVVVITLLKNFKWLVLGGTAIAVAWIVVQ